ncbi:MAG: hypothetical protein LUG18_12465 [Candidatus Azobacteroides sp.]|nr:hypothetical protein [Candidatus Azobacteroides sp.]
MADGTDGEVSMNYAIKNQNGNWEVLRLYTFRKFEDGVYYRDAILETNPDITFRLAEIPLANGILRIDKIYTPVPVDIRLGHYSLPQLGEPLQEKSRKILDYHVPVIDNGKYELAMVPLAGWNNTEILYTYGLHPVRDKAAVINARDTFSGEKIYITFNFWKKGDKEMVDTEWVPVEDIRISEGQETVQISFRNGTIKTISFH